MADDGGHGPADEADWPRHEARHCWVLSTGGVGGVAGDVEEEGVQ